MDEVRPDDEGSGRKWSSYFQELISKEPQRLLQGSAQEVNIRVCGNNNHDFVYYALNTIRMSYVCTMSWISMK
ncbi:hypothetical protein Bca4012_032477 [Brassica carinata]